MAQQETDYWKPHPLRKAITVLIAFYIVLSLSTYCPLEVPILGILCGEFILLYFKIGICVWIYVWNMARP